jgi:hypothetical protein
MLIRSQSFGYIGIIGFFLLIILIVSITTKVSFADTIQNEERPILEWEKLWYDLEASECNYQAGIRFKKLDVRTDGTEFENGNPFSTPGGNKKFSSDSPEDEIPYESGICVADLWPKNTPGLAKYKRRDIFAFYAYENERTAKAVFENVVQNDSWMLGWLPVRNAPGRGDLPDPSKFKVRVNQEKQKALISGGSERTEDISKIIYTKSGMKFKPAHYKIRAQLALYIKRYKTVVMIWGFWRVVETDYYETEPKLADLIRRMPQNNPDSKEMEKRAKTIVDERVRFFRLELVDPDPNTKYLDIHPAKPEVSVKVTECFDGCDEPGARWTAVDEKKPANVLLNMFEYNDAKPPAHVTHIDGKYPPNRKDLINAYSGREFPPRFDALDKSSNRYVTKAKGIVPGISLAKGVKFVYSEKNPSQHEVSDTYILDFNDLGGLLYDSYNSRVDRYRSIVGDVGATIVAEAYHISRKGKVVALARSKPKHVRYTHVAEVVHFGQDDHPVIKPHKYYSPEHVFYDGKKLSQNEGFARALKKGLRLMPNDLIPFGRFDYVRIKYLLLDQEWCIQADPEVVPRGRLTFFVIQPAKIRPWNWVWEKIARPHGSSLIACAGGIGTVLVSVAEGVKVTTGYGILTTAVFLVVDRIVDWEVELVDKMWNRKNLRFLNVAKLKSMFSVRVSENETTVTVLEGEVNFNDMSNNQIALEQGHMSKLDSKATLSAPKKFDQASLPASIKSALERLKKDLPPEEDSLKEHTFRLKQAEEDSAYAWIKIAAERGFFIFRELKKLPIMNQMKTIAEKAGRKHMVENFNNRVAELGENIDQALATYADAFQELENMDRTAIDTGFQKYSQFLVERNATEQLTVLKTVKDHLFAYLGESKTDKEKWRRDFAGI